VLGTPEEITDPMTIMLWGMTTERVESWLAPDDTAAARTLIGLTGSPGAAEGRARVILHADQLGQLEEGEILVAPSTATSWTPVFGTIAAAVSDVGGVMCHAAIVAREYGLPAVVGAASATKTIKTGDRIRVDGDTGLVTLLD
jgi:pyruvate,water dikinase